MELIVQIYTFLLEKPLEIVWPTFMTTASQKSYNLKTISSAAQPIVELMTFRMGLTVS